MRNIVMLVLVLGAWCASDSSAQESTPAAPQPAAAAGAGYAWAGACKDCHAAIYASWAKTKHARAIDRLGGGERKAGSTCVGCHITGGAEPVEADGHAVNLNVQCESCHGPGQAHVAAAAAGNAASARMVKTPPEKVCVQCHNESSPKFRGFYYAALKGLSHPK